MWVGSISLNTGFCPLEFWLRSVHDKMHFFVIKLVAMCIPSTWMVVMKYHFPFLSFFNFK